MELHLPKKEITEKKPQLTTEVPGCDYATVLLERHNRGMQYEDVVFEDKTIGALQRAVEEAIFKGCIK